jgi:hypothetical protein
MLRHFKLDSHENFSVKSMHLVCAVEKQNPLFKTQ